MKDLNLDPEMLDNEALDMFGVTYNALGKFGKWEVENSLKEKRDIKNHLEHWNCLDDTTDLSIDDFTDSNEENAPDRLKTFIDPLIDPIHVSHKDAVNLLSNFKDQSEFYEKILIRQFKDWFIYTVFWKGRIVTNFKSIGICSKIIDTNNISNAEIIIA